MARGISWRKWAIGLSCVITLIAVYFLTYRAYPISRDEWFLFDATESMARRGTLERNYEYDATPPLTLHMFPPPPADTEPLQPILASGLFLFAQEFPAIGLAHTVWLFNVLVTALTAGLVYIYGTDLDYSPRVAASVALIYGLGTIAWPYSHLYFREPLFTLLALLSVYYVMLVRQRLTRSKTALLPGIGLAIALMGALFSKEVSLLLLPALIVEALPARLERVRFSRRKIVIVLGLILSVVLVAGVVLSVSTLLGIQRYLFSHRISQLRANLSGAAEGIRGFMISPGRSMWLYSPVLVLGCWGIILLARARRWRQILTPFVVLISFTIGYAAVRGAHLWTGGLGWGPRYLVPVTPFLALWLLPVIANLFERRAAWLPRLIVGGIVGVSVGLQVLASMVSLLTFYDTLAADELAAYDDIWVWRSSAIPGYLDLLGDHDPDWAWLYATDDAWLLPVLCVALAMVACGWLFWWASRPDSSLPRLRAFMFTAITLLPLTAITLVGGLYGIRYDRRYSGEFQPLRDLWAQLEPQLESDDVIVLNDFTYNEFFQNYYKRRSPVVYTLTSAPGERSNPEQPPAFDTSYPDEAIHFSTSLLAAHFATQTDRLWLVINTSRFIPWSTRPVEAYLARHYFPVREVYPSDLARAVLFDLTSAPPATALSWPEYPVNADFGDQVRLVGYDLPGGAVRQAGDVLPVALLWEALTSVANDYTVALLLFSMDGTLIAQHDAFPVYYFEPMTSWRAGSLHRDNHGLQLPANLPPGEYELAVVLYFWQAPDERLPVTDAAGNPAGDHALLIPITIRP